MEALRERNFRLLFAGRAVSYVGTYLAPIAVAFAVLDLGGSATAVGLSFAAWTVAQVSMLAFGGVIGDRLPRRAVMIAGDSASFVVRLVMGLLLVSGHAQVWELIVLQALGGASVALYNPAFYGLVREIVRPELLQQANGYLAIARYAAFPVGAAFGGTIVATVGSGAALIFDAATYGVSALLLSQVHVESLARAGDSFLRELREGWSAFVEYTWLWVLVLWIALYFLITYAPFFVLGPYIAKHSMGGASTWGIVVTGEGLGALLGGLAGVRFRPRRPLVARLRALPADSHPERAARLPRPSRVARTRRGARRVRLLVRLRRLGHRRPADDRPGQARTRRARTAGWAPWCFCPPGMRSQARSPKSSACAPICSSAQRG